LHIRPYSSQLARSNTGNRLINLARAEPMAAVKHGGRPVVVMAVEVLNALESPAATPAAKRE
jgi:hypothetical protein